VAWFAGFGVAGDVGVDRLVEAVEVEIDAAVAVAVSAGGADGVGREKVEVAADVEVVLAQVSGRDLKESAFDPLLRPAG
jgi:hypothetical protein